GWPDTSRFCRRRVRTEDRSDAVGLPARDLAAHAIERVVRADVDAEGIGRQDLGGLCGGRRLRGLIERRATLIEELLRVRVAEARDEPLATSEQIEQRGMCECVPCH